MGWLTKIGGFLFGGGSGGGIVTDISDAVDRWNPSETTRHKMSIEDQKVGDNSQDSARGLKLRGGSTWFDNLIDGLNRLVRPVMTFWVFGILTGMLGIPAHLMNIPPMLWNIIWTIITFWFGSRLVFKDVPKLFNKANVLKDVENMKKMQDEMDSMRERLNELESEEEEDTVD